MTRDRVCGYHHHMAKPLKPGDILPSRRLTPSSGGVGVKVGANRHRSQVLVVTHRKQCDECTAYLASFAAVADGIRAEKAEVLALVGADWDTLPLETPAVAFEDDGGLAARLSPDDEPVVAVADRYGQLFLVEKAGAEHRFPQHQRIVHCLLDIGIRCPECGVPDVPSGMVLPEAGTKSGGIPVHQ